MVNYPILQSNFGVCLAGHVLGRCRSRISVYPPLSQSAIARRLALGVRPYSNAISASKISRD